MQPLTARLRSRSRTSFTHAYNWCDENKYGSSVVRFSTKLVINVLHGHVVNFLYQGSTLVMSNFGGPNLKDNKKASFWKKNAKSVPGKWVSNLFLFLSKFLRHHFLYLVPRNCVFVVSTQ